MGFAKSSRYNSDLVAYTRSGTLVPLILSVQCKRYMLNVIT